MSSFRDAMNMSAESVKYLENGNKHRHKSNDKSIRRSNSNSKNSDDLGHVPEEPSPSDIGSEKKSSTKLVSDVLTNLERLIVYDDWTNNPSLLDGTSVVLDSTAKKKQLPRLDELSRTVITSYSLQAYIKLLSRNHGHSIAAYLHKTTNDLLTKVFRFSNGVARFHDEFYAGFGYALKSARKAVRAREKQQKGNHSHHHSRGDDGIIYLSPGLPYADLPQYLTTEFGATQIHSIPAMQTAYINVDSRLDVGAFEKQLENDVNVQKKVPLLVVAVVGSFVFGHNDLVSKLLELRDRFYFYLHLVGLNVAALAISEPQDYLLRVIQSTDSFTVPLGTWLGVQGLPYVTMQKSAPIDNNNAQSPLSFRENLESLPWWITVNDLTIENMKKRLDDAYTLSKTMLKYLAKFAQIEILGLGSVVDVLNRIEKKTLTPPAVLTFKYIPVGDIIGKFGKTYQDTAIEDDYIDCLNLWLGQGLMHECSYLALQLVDLSMAKLGMAIRYCPLETAAGYKCTVDKISHFSKHLESMLSILDITVASKLKLPEYLADKPELRAVKVPAWAGVTGLIYLPEMLRDKHKKWNDKQKEQVSHLNIELVHALRASDSAFSLGEGEDGVKCVKFGMLADERDLMELINLVASKGQEIEESSQYMDSLAEIVKQGIEAANEDLKKENESRLINEGVLRQVPLVGSVMNWWAPLPKQQSNMKGRAFDLITGRILPTDTVYKHKSMTGSGDYETTETEEYTEESYDQGEEGYDDEYDEESGEQHPESESYTETDYMAVKSQTT